MGAENKRQVERHLRALGAPRDHPRRTSGLPDRGERRRPMLTPPEPTSSDGAPTSASPPNYAIN
jgi:hypothetical protein